MSLKSCILALGLMLATGPAFAAGAAGTWNASVDTPQGPFALVFNFAVDGSTLTGTMSNDMMGATPITDGMVDGDNVSFTLSMMGTMTVHYRGSVAGDELTLSSKFEGTPPPGVDAEGTLVATRAD